MPPPLKKYQSPDGNRASPYSSEESEESEEETGEEAEGSHNRHFNGTRQNINSEQRLSPSGSGSEGSEVVPLHGQKESSAGLSLWMDSLQKRVENSERWLPSLSGAGDVQSPYPNHLLQRDSQSPFLEPVRLPRQIPIRTPSAFPRQQNFSPRIPPSQQIPSQHTPPENSSAQSRHIPHQINTVQSNVYSSSEHGDEGEEESGHWRPINENPRTTRRKQLSSENASGDATIDTPVESERV